MSHVLLYSLLLEDLPLCHHVEEGARGDGDGDSILGFGLGVNAKVEKALAMHDRIAEWLACESPQMA